MEIEEIITKFRDEIIELNTKLYNDMLEAFEKSCIERDNILKGNPKT